MAPAGPTFVDLFCGAGGWSHGLRRAGWRHLVGVDLNRHALSAYVANHGHGICKAVGDVTAADLAAFGAVPGAVDVLVASPPCQSFSMAGRREPGHPHDTLFLDALRVAGLLRPRVVLMENVPGFVTKRDPATRRTALDALVAALRRRGYRHVDHCILDATDYEVPQRRRRFVVVASRDAPASPGAFPPQRVPGFDPSVGRFLQPAEGVTDPFYWLSPDKIRYYEERKACPRTAEYVRYVEPSLPASTVRASYMKSRGAEALVRHSPTRVRLLTELELARIQSFPDAYAFEGARGHRYVQIGNAVPPNLAYHVGVAVAAWAGL